MRQPTSPASTEHSAIDGSRPNVVLIVADDLDSGSIARLPNVDRLLASAGTAFSRFFVTTPVCCPSRASILSGQYAHNHGVLKNGAERGGFHTFHLRGGEESTLATWLQDGGYRTGLVGKYLNGYPNIPKRFAAPRVSATYVPPGWDEWHATIHREAAANFDYALNENGTIVRYGGAAAAYLTDVLAAKADGLIRRWAAAEQPFFLLLAPYVPHWPAVPAPRHEAAFANETAPRPPSFDEGDVADKPAYLRDASRLAPAQIAAIDEHHRQRLRSLLSLDELVAGVLATLRSTGALATTHVLLTSDHGWHAGEHRLPFGKQTPYEEAIRAPLLARGPGTMAGAAVDAPVLNIDLAPTIADLAAVTPPPTVDGRSFAPLLRAEPPRDWRRAFLVEHLGLPRAISYPGLGQAPRIPTYDALRVADALVADLVYVEYATGELEFYDLAGDPHQLRNAAATLPPAHRDVLAARLDRLRRCAGALCRVAEDEPPRLDPCVTIPDA